MFTINKTYSATFEEKKSKFIAYLCPYSKFNDLLEDLKNEHPKARHIVTAFRYLNELEQIVEGSSDDKEPRGTAGKPALHVLQGGELINVGVLIVRYFGGIKLGTGGLVRAYSDAVNLALKECELIKYEKKDSFKFTCSYNDLSKIEYHLQKIGIIETKKDFLPLHVEVNLEATPKQIEEFNAYLSKLQPMKK